MSTFHREGNLKWVPGGTRDRRHYIGGSAIACILGLQPPKWRTATELWLRMTADEPEVEAPAALRKRYARGKVVEPLVAHMLADMYGVPPGAIASVSNRQYEDAVHPHFAAEIDFELPLGSVRHLFHDEQWIHELPDEYRVNVEIKTVHAFATKEWGEAGTDEIPIHYAAQVYWGMGVTDRKLAIAAALFGADDLQLYPLVADAETIGGMRLKAAEFWELVQTRTMPIPQTVKDTIKLWPVDKGNAVEANEEVLNALATYQAMCTKRDTYDGGADGCSLLIREHMKDATVLEIDGVKLATLKAQGRTTIDADKLKAEFPAAYSACTRTSSTRVLRLPKKD